MYGGRKNDRTEGADKRARDRGLPYHSEPIIANAQPAFRLEGVGDAAMILR